MAPDHVLISTAEAARILDLSVDRVRQLDAVLQPQRVSGRRAYVKTHVEQVATERAQRKAPAP